MLATVVLIEAPSSQVDAVVTPQKARGMQAYAMRSDTTYIDSQNSPAASLRIDDENSVTARNRLPQHDSAIEILGGDRIGTTLAAHAGCLFAGEFCVQ
jgi:hypothetical protein